MNEEEKMNKAFFLFCIVIVMQSCSMNPVRIEYAVDDSAFAMIRIPAKAFPSKLDNSSVAGVGKAFEISETEVTYRLWRTVYQWATSAQRGEAKYAFSHAGRAGGSSADAVTREADHPVTEVSWRDCLVWTNALTEWYAEKKGVALLPVYYEDAGFAAPLRSSLSIESIEQQDAIPERTDNPFVRGDANGFRLCYKDEWELAARYRADFNNDGDICDEGEFYRGSSASGAAENIYDTVATGEVAWYGINSGGTSHPVKTKKPTSIGLYDMSGNAYEWCFEWDSLYTGKNRVYRGGSWSSNHRQLGIGILYYNGAKPFFTSDSLGFRTARNAST